MPLTTPPQGASTPAQPGRRAVRRAREPAGRLVVGAVALRGLLAGAGPVGHVSHRVPAHARRAMDRAPGALPVAGALARLRGALDVLAAPHAECRRARPVPPPGRGRLRRRRGREALDFIARNPRSLLANGLRRVYWFWCGTTRGEAADPAMLLRSSCARSRRCRGGVRAPASADELVPEAVDGQDELRVIAVGLDLASQPGHVRVDRARGGHRVVAPDVVQQLVS